MLAELRATAPANVTVREADAGTVDASLGTFELVTIGRALHWLGGDAYLERLEPLTTQVALLGDRISDSEAFSTVLALAEEITGRATAGAGKARKLRERASPVGLLRGHEPVGRGRADVDERQPRRLGLLDVVRVA